MISPAVLPAHSDRSTRIGLPSVFIILVTYDMKAETQCCLSSLRGLSYPNHRLVVVDNGSSDGTESMVRSKFPQTVTIQTGKNSGYTGGNNRGIEYALAAGADYVLIMNPDTVLASPDFLDEMVDYMETHPRVGIAGPRVFLREQGKVQNTVLFAPGLWRNICQWARFRIAPGSCAFSGDTVVDAEALNGVCLLLRTACLRDIGLFDENIFMYIEDVEMDARARRHGWQIQYLPIDSIIHKQRREGYGFTSEVNFLIKRNSVYYLCKAGRRVEARVYAGLSLSLMAMRALYPFRRQRLKEYLQFCRRLAAAYRTILKEKTPPAARILSAISARTPTSLSPASRFETMMPAEVIPQQKLSAQYRITWLHNEPSPNQMEFFQELGKRPEVSLRVLTCSATFSRRPFPLGTPWIGGNGYSFSYKVLKGINLPLGRHREFYVNPEVVREIFRSSRDELWVVGGYAIPTVQLAMWALRLRNLNWILVNEAPLVQSPVRDLVRRALLLPVRLGAKGVLVYGSHSKAKFYSRFLPASKVANTAQYQNLSPLMAIEKDAEAFTCDRPRPLRFLYAGRLEKFSGVDLLVRAFNRLARAHPDVELEILGEGSQRLFLQQSVEEGIKPRVTFHGAVSRKEVPGIFARGDIFVHPNHAQGWGMVVNEALAAGMPVIASKTVGAAEQLLIDGINGFLLDSPHDEDGYFTRMKYFAEHRESLPDFIRNARRSAAGISLDTGVSEFLAVIDKLLSPSL